MIFAPKQLSNFACFFIFKIISLVLFYYPPSSGISSCVRTVDTMMCLHTWHRPACVALGWALIQGFVNWVPLPRMRPPVDRDGVTA